MATHQEIAQVSDQDFLDQMIKTHDNRFNDNFWQFISEEVGPQIPEKPLIVNVTAAPLRKCLKPHGIFLLHDWIARPLPEYLDRMLENVPEEEMVEAAGQMFKPFPSHNKYTVDDWNWLLTESGFKIFKQSQLASPHFQTFVCQKS